ncbi:hypothetical protein COLU111180_06255 [Cohnella lubricantis]|uniref:Uncharacterized protein n=1 Tax=Cohnella lubricantis TaxID=2163172 RepID=A0A841TBW7_9BACL|nr:hypothetical protein [Cohnella lubricantis]MBB6677519.1 hypothetical protein [Cohnella lubricantis]MBP2116595.1 hypothetical protein [Cohnella lubricantis]
MAVVLKDFKCKVTKKLFRSGDAYEGDRAEELAALGYVAEGGGNSDLVDTWPKHIGGGEYELSNGEKVKGKKAALAAQAEIDEADDE